MRSGHRSRGRTPIPNRGGRARTAARVVPKGLPGDLRALPRALAATTLPRDSGTRPLHVPEPHPALGLGDFLGLRRKMPPRFLGEGAARLPAGALQALPAAPPRAALIKAGALEGLICPLSPPKKQTNQPKPGRTEHGEQAAVAAMRSFGRATRRARARPARLAQGRIYAEGGGESKQKLHPK